MVDTLPKTWYYTYMIKTYSEEYLKKNRGSIYTEKVGKNTSLEVKAVSKDVYVIILHSPMAMNLSEVMFRGTLNECRRNWSRFHGKYSKTT